MFTYPPVRGVSSVVVMDMVLMVRVLVGRAPVVADTEPCQSSISIFSYTHIRTCTHAQLHGRGLQHHHVRRAPRRHVQGRAEQRLVPHLLPLGRQLHRLLRLLGK